jgi:hypothetical protein
MVFSFVGAEWIGWPVIEGSRGRIDYLGRQGNLGQENAG